MSSSFIFTLIKNLKNIHSHKLSQDYTVCPKNEKWEEDFSILEVLVTILVITGFILASLQATVLATLLRVQAQDKQEATNLVQEDLELIRYHAFMLTSTPANCGSYGTTLQADLEGKGYTDAVQTISVNGRSYDIDRTYNPSENILQISYSVSYDDNQPHPRYTSTGDNVVTTLSTEVLPNAALSCN